MVSRLTSVQKPLHTCEEHEHQEMDNYCMTCKKPVCVQCVKKEHKEHDWDSMKNVARMLRAQTAKGKVEIESISKSFVTGFNETLTFVSNRKVKADCSNLNRLESTRKALVEYVNDEIDKMKTTCQKNQEANTEAIQSQRDKIKIKESRLRRLLQEMETGALEFTDFDLIEMHEELENLIAELSFLGEIPSDLHGSMVYKPGPSSLSGMASFLGSLEVQQITAKPVQAQEIQYSESSIRNICLLPGNTAWVQANDTTCLNLVDNKGNVKRSLDVQEDYADFTVDKNNKLYFIDQNAKCVMKSDDNQKIKLLSSTAPLIPSSIYVTRSEDILVCLTEIETSSDGTKSLRYFVRRMTKCGEMIRDNELVCDKITLHYGSPWQVVESANGNICVLVFYIKANDDDPKFSVIYCTNCTGKTVFKYGKEAQFGILDICPDMTGNILASEFENKRIHIIDPKGNFVRFLLNQDSFKYIYREQLLFLVTIFGSGLTG